MTILLYNVSSMSKENNPNMDRRDFMRKALIVTAAAVGGAVLYEHWANSTDHDGQPDQGDPSTANGAPAESVVPDTSFGPTFANEQAEQAADSLGITSGSYFKLSPEVVEKVNESHSFATESRLLPIFPPAVMKNAEVIETAAQRNDIPPNIFATLATIESAGNANAHSGADAWGIVQVVPRYHLDKYVKHGYLPQNASYADYQAAKRGDASQVSSETYIAAFTNNEATANVGAEYFAECIHAARQKNPKLTGDDLRIFAIAAAAYNGGPGLAGQAFEKWPLESKLYVNFVSRFILDLEVASKLRQSGMVDKSILAAMQSREVEARAYAYSKFKYSDFDSYERRAQLFTYPTPGVDPSVGNVTNDDQKQAQANWQAYGDHKANVPGGVNNQYVIPAPPALRIWLASGGMNLFASGDAPEENKNWRLDP